VRASSIINQVRRVNAGKLILVEGGPRLLSDFYAEKILDEQFLTLAPRVPVRTEVEAFPLEQANDALDRLRRGEIRGSAVLTLAT